MPCGRYFWRFTFKDRGPGSFACQVLEEYATGVEKVLSNPWPTMVPGRLLQEDS